MPEVTLSLPVALAFLAGFLVIGAGALYFSLQGTGHIQAPTAIPSPTNTATLTSTPTDTLIPTDTPTLTPQPPVSYTVQAGDSCGAIASLYNSSVTAIISLNSLNSTCTNLAIGQKILGALGRKHEVVDHYQKYVYLLRKDLGLDPPLETRSLYASLIA